MEPIRILHFSDVLCIWAYISQIRLEELKATFQDRVSIEHHFVTIFGNTHEKLELRWHDRGGLSGYAEHVRESAKKFTHINLHPNIWTQSTPTSSISAHLFLCAIRTLETKGTIDKSDRLFERAIAIFREEFFTKTANVSDRRVQFEIVAKLGLSVADIQAQIDSGDAYAQLSKDMELVKEHHISVSPTLILNEGRQRLNGNVGYRTIEANIRELLNNPPGEKSWC